MSIHRCRPGLRALALAVALVVVAAACSSDEGEGDLEAFCGLLEDGAILTTAAAVDTAEDGESTAAADSDINPTDFDPLVDAAPPEIRPAVRNLQNTARDLDEIDETDLAALFAAAFDPEAVAARRQVEAFAADECGIDLAGGEEGEVLGGLLESEGAGAADTLRELDDYVRATFEGEAWVELVTYRSAIREGALESIRAVFEEAPDDRQAVRLCRALAIYLFELNDGTGSVRVETGSELLASQEGPDEQCQEP